MTMTDTMMLNDGTLATRRLAKKTSMQDKLNATWRTGYFAGIKAGLRIKGTPQEKLYAAPAVELQ